MKHYFSYLKGVRFSCFSVFAVGVVGMSYGLHDGLRFPLCCLPSLFCAGGRVRIYVYRHFSAASGGNPLAAAAAGLLAMRHVPFLA